MMFNGRYPTIAANCAFVCTVVSTNSRRITKQPKWSSGMILASGSQPKPLSGGRCGRSPVQTRVWACYFCKCTALCFFFGDHNSMLRVCFVFIFWLPRSAKYL
jgi:hypothetical protein